MVIAILNDTYGVGIPDSKPPDTVIQRAHLLLETKGTAQYPLSNSTAKHLDGPSEDFSRLLWGHVLLEHSSPGKTKRRSPE